MKRSLAVCVAIFLTASAALAISCGNGDSNDDDDDDDDGATPFDFDDDGTADDDSSADDDSEDDDDVGDIDDDNAAPLIHSGEWLPETIERGDLGALNWKVCDAMDNLDGGWIFLMWAGTNDSFVDDPLYWDDVEGGVPSAPDCSFPASVTLSIDLSALEIGEYCTDLEATDADGNLSNQLENLCVTIVEPPL